MKSGIVLGLLAALLVAGPLCTTSSAQATIYVDFDDDANPWTLRTNLPEGVQTATAWFVLEAPASGPPDGEFFGQVAVACVGDPFWFHHYGVEVNPDSLVFDARYLSSLWIGVPTCLECCPNWPIGGRFATGAPVVPGERYFVGQAVWHANCDDIWQPPPEFTVTFLENCAGTSAMRFHCPDVRVEPAIWGDVKRLYRD
jgi:hypothetical protein